MKKERLRIIRKESSSLSAAVPLIPIEKVAAVYCILTSLLMVVLWPRLDNPLGMISTRVIWLLMTITLVLLTTPLRRLLRHLSHTSTTADQTTASTSTAIPLSLGTFLQSHLSPFLRTIAQLAYLILWYPDTYEFNRIFDNLDHRFAALDLHLFGCQPSLTFSNLLPGTFWSEAFNLGYWSYYPSIALLAFAVLYMEWKESRTTAGEITHSPFILVTTTILTAFFLYYLVYIFLPVAGPQFYFQAVGVNEIVQGHFPALGTYFSSHNEMLPAPGNPDGLFYQLVSSAQATGERPTAAFPSSHIGISTIVLLLARRHVPRLLIILLPLWFLLCCATVYIQAHYLVDAIAGLISAFCVLPLAEWLLHPLFGPARPDNRPT